jgi:hypothetical protein
MNALMQLLIAALNLLLILDFIHLPVSPCRGAAFEPSSAFQSRESRYVVV